MGFLVESLKQEARNGNPFWLFGIMKKAFVSISFRRRDQLECEKRIISEVLKKHHIIPLIFVDLYSFTSDEKNEMMKKAMEEIEKSDFIIAEVSDKAIGVGIEIGYAYALKKKIIYLRTIESDYSTTVGGLATGEIVYESCDDLEKKLDAIISKIN